jgi:hypothetical protein
VITSNRCSLSIYSETGTAADVTAALEIEPTRAEERGTQSRRNLDLPGLKPLYRVRPDSYWAFDADEALIDPADQTGFGSLRVLMNVFREKAEILAQLRPEYDTVILWSGFSDSWQGGFVLPADLLVDLGHLGCHLYGTAYLEEPDELDES